MFIDSVFEAVCGLLFLLGLPYNLVAQVVYKADRLTKLIERKETFETKLERMYDRLIATPRATRPTVKVRIRLCQGGEMLLTSINIKYYYGVLFGCFS